MLWKSNPGESNFIYLFYRRNSARSAAPFGVIAAVVVRICPCRDLLGESFNGGLQEKPQPFSACYQELLFYHYTIKRSWSLVLWYLRSPHSVFKALGGSLLAGSGDLKLEP